MDTAQDDNTLIVAMVAIVQENRILLIEESKSQCRGKWFLPAGRSAANEPIVQTAIREAKEETGLDVELTGLLYLDQLTCAQGDSGGNRLRFIFTGISKGGDLKKTEDEHSIRAAWFGFDQARTLDLRSPIVLRVLDLLEGNPSILPIASIRMLSAADRMQERP